MTQQEMIAKLEEMGFYIIEDREEMTDGGKIRIVSFEHPTSTDLCGMQLSFAS